MESISKNKKEILNISLNDDKTLFIISMNIGFAVYKCIPLELIFIRELNGGIAITKLLGNSNIFCLVGGGDNPKYKNNKIIIWDDTKLKEIEEYRFKSIIRDCYIREDYLISVSDYEITIINYKTKEILEEFQTIYNNKGISAFSPNINSSILIYPIKEQGSLIIKNIKKNKSEKKVKVHENPIILIKINDNSTLFATASNFGTLIRIFSTLNGNMLNEVRRGTESAIIYDISFDITNDYIGVISNRSTVHIFSISIRDDKNNSIFKTVGNIIGMPKILNSERSFMQLKLNLNSKAIILINSNNKKGFILDYNGNYTLTSFGTIINNFKFEKLDERDILKLI